MKVHILPLLLTALAIIGGGATTTAVAQTLITSSPTQEVEDDAEMRVRLARKYGLPDSATLSEIRTAANVANAPHARTEQERVRQQQEDLDRRRVTTLEARQQFLQNTTSTTGFTLEWRSGQRRK